MIVKVNEILEKVNKLKEFFFSPGLPYPSKVIKLKMGDHAISSTG